MTALKQARLMAAFGRLLTAELLVSGHSRERLLSEQPGDRSRPRLRTRALDW